MVDRFYSPEDVADFLDLNVRTVRGYVRTGKLPAVRIGKQYRIARADLLRFTGRTSSPSAAKESVAATVTTVVRLDGIPPEQMQRVSALMHGAAQGRSDPDRSLQLQLLYDEEAPCLHVTIVGDPADTARALDIVHAFLETLA